MSTSLQPRHHTRQRIVTIAIGFVAILVVTAVSPSTLRADGEPAAEFVEQLRAANYFDTAISYLDRLDDFPGVEAEFNDSIELEKAQIYIDAAVASRVTTERDEKFSSAERSLTAFLNTPAGPRHSEARSRLGKLQMIRATQLLAGEPDDAKRSTARESYLGAAKTFDAIIDDLKEKLRGQNIDANDPKKVQLRNRQRGEYLEALLNSGEAKRLAARTYDNPTKEGRKLLEEALARFTDLSDKYDGYVAGAQALLSRGQVQQTLDMTDEALDSYIRMLEMSDADPLRDAKFQAATGLIQLYMAESPPQFAPAIQRGDGLLKTARPAEQRSPSIQELRYELAHAHLAKSEAENQKAADKKRATSTARQLLIAASKNSGTHDEKVAATLATLGIDSAESSELPLADDPQSLEEAMATVRELYQASEQLKQSLDVLKKTENPSDDIRQQITNVETQLSDSQSTAIEIMRRGLAMISLDADAETVNQARQLMSYLLYQEQRYRESAAVGGFLARTAPGTDVGLKGGLLALTSMQMLVSQLPEDQNSGAIAQLQKFGQYLADTWPDDPQATAAKGILIRLAITQGDWQQARQRVQAMPTGTERSKNQRLLGQLLWNESIRAKDDPDRTKQLWLEAQQELQAGFTEIAEPIGTEEMQASLTLAKILLRLGQSEQALAMLDHPQYGPIALLAKLGVPNDSFAGDLYSTELQSVVQQMTTPGQDAEQLLARATSVMENLQASFSAESDQSRLTGIYFRLATDIREQLDSAQPAAKAKLTEAFRVFLDRIASTTSSPATLQWVGKTLIELGESSMSPTDVKANGQAASLLASAAQTFEGLASKDEETPLAVKYQLARVYRLLGRYKDAIDTMQEILEAKPMMLDGQFEAALAYESWAGEVQPKFAPAAYKTALNGGRKGADGENVIWGWGRISQLTARNPKYREMFFEARYHLALCRYKWGMSANDDALIKKSQTDITQVAVLYPDLGGGNMLKKFDGLMRQIQAKLGQPPIGL